MRKSGFAVLIPAVLLGLLILPNITNAILKPSVNVTPSHPVHHEKPLVSETVYLEPNKLVRIKIGKLPIFELDVKFPRYEEAVLNIYPAKISLNEEYKVIYAYDIVFKDPKTGKTLEPAGFIYFKVPRDMVENPKLVVMLKYHEKLIELKTKLIKQDNESYYYVAETDSFSIYIVAEKRVVNMGCAKCHPEVATELSVSPYHNFRCTFCHPGMSRNVTCVQCHKLIGNFSAHKKFIEWAENNTLMMGSNEACIACHTHAKIPIYNVTERKFISFEFNMADLYK